MFFEKFKQLHSENKYAFLILTLGYGVVSDNN